MRTATTLTAVLVTVVWIGAIVRWKRRTRIGSGATLPMLQWAYAGGLASLLVACFGFMLQLLLDWPSDVAITLIAATTCLPVSLFIAHWARARPYAHRALAASIVIVGLMLMVGAIYVAMVIGLGRAPEDHERTMLLLSMLAAGLAAVLAIPARHRLEAFAAQHVIGFGRSPDEALAAFSGRMTRSVPMDELLLQLAETLRDSMSLAAAEIWTGKGGVLTRAVSVPDRAPERLTLSEAEVAVLARSRVQGNSWIDVWLPALMTDRENANVRVAATAHLGELLGLIVVERNADAASFSEDEERLLHEVARQVGLALHNIMLDSALQASLDELELRNEQLAASRLRIVTAADESRRQIERNLHDGAQQHLVALAVKVGLVKTLLDTDPDTALAMIDELRSDVQDTLAELRELAHGIYPPLLRDRGLGEALVNAANRATLPTTVVAEGVGRYDTEIEAAIYFCCLEAVQNAGKHAGDQATITIELGVDPHETLWFEVRDDGTGFDASIAPNGHGFVNMRDRLGVFGGDLEVRSSSEAGTIVRGSVAASDRRSTDAADSNETGRGG